MQTLYLVLYVLASLSFAVYALRIRDDLRFVGLGVLFWSLVPLIQTIIKLAHR